MGLFQEDDFAVYNEDLFTFRNGSTDSIENLFLFLIVLVETLTIERSSDIKKKQF